MRTEISGTGWSSEKVVSVQRGAEVESRLLLGQRNATKRVEAISLYLSQPTSQPAREIWQRFHEPLRSAGTYNDYQVCSQRYGAALSTRKVASSPISPSAVKVKWRRRTKLERKNEFAAPIQRVVIPQRSVMITICTDNSHNRCDSRCRTQKYQIKSIKCGGYACKSTKQWLACR